MISLLSLAYLVYGSFVVQSQSVTPQNPDTSIFSPKSLMCSFRGNMAASDSELVNLDPIDIPCECDVIVYCRFSIDLSNSFDYDQQLLQQVLDLNKPVIVEIHRTYQYFDWIDLLQPGEEYPETALLRDFALQNNIIGFILTDIAPENLFQTYSPTVGPNLAAYITQLKGNSNLIVGLSVQPFPAFLKNVNTYNFAELNAIVDYYEIETVGTNLCKPNLYNGRVPIEKTEYGLNYYLGMKSITEILTETAIDINKVVYVIEMIPVTSCSDDYKSYHQVCTNNFDPTGWCIQNTNDYFLKGSYVREQNAGCNVVYVELDDTLDECGCGKFIGLKNIVAGFYGGQTTSCPAFDVQQSSIV